MHRGFDSASRTAFDADRRGDPRRIGEPAGGECGWRFSLDRRFRGRARSAPRELASGARDHVAGIGAWHGFVGVQSSAGSADRRGRPSQPTQSQPHVRIRVTAHWGRPCACYSTVRPRRQHIRSRSESGTSFRGTSLSHHCSGRRNQQSIIVRRSCSRHWLVAFTHSSMALEQATGGSIELRKDSMRRYRCPKRPNTRCKGQNFPSVPAEPLATQRSYDDGSSDNAEFETTSSANGFRPRIPVQISRQTGDRTYTHERKHCVLGRAISMLGGDN